MRTPEHRTFPEGGHEFREAKKPEELIKKNSDFTGSPITLHVEKNEEKELSDDQDEAKKVEMEAEDKIKDVNEKKKATTVKHKWELVNKSQPL
jgi:molecular chaperone HtpG